MATLQGRAIKDTYKDLLQVSNSNAGVDATLRTIEDGEGTSSALEVSTGKVNIDGNLQIGGSSIEISKKQETASGNNNDVVVIGESNFVGAGITSGNSIALSSSDIENSYVQVHAPSGDTNTMCLFGNGLSTGVLNYNTGTWNSTTNTGAIQTAFALRSTDTQYPAGQGGGMALQMPLSRLTLGHDFMGQAALAIQNVDDRFTTATSLYPLHGAGNSETGGTVTGMNLGASGQKFKQLFASTATIATSDQNAKTEISELSEAEKRVAVALKGLVKKFKFKSAVTIKGENARTHIGLIAQEVQAAFEAEGLDATDYSLFCIEKFYECTDKDGNVSIAGYQKLGEDCVEKTQLGIRYEEVIAFIISAL